MTNVPNAAEFASQVPVMGQGVGDKPLHPSTESGETRGPTAPADGVQQAQQEAQAQPRPSEAPSASPQDNTPRIPKSRLDKEIAAKRKLQEQVDSTRKEMAELRDKLEKAEFESRVQSLVNGQGRPGDWETMSPEAQQAWTLHQQAELLRSMSERQTEPVADTSASDELARRLDRLEFQQSTGLPVEQAAYIAELRDETGISSVTELKALAAMRQPQLFANETEGAVPPAQFQQSPGRQMGNSVAEKGPNLESTLKGLHSADPGMDAERAGGKLIQQIAEDLIWQPKGLSP